MDSHRLCPFKLSCPKTRGPWTTRLQHPALPRAPDGRPVSPHSRLRTKSVTGARAEGWGMSPSVTRRETPKLLKVPSTPDQGGRGPGMTMQWGGWSTARPRASTHQRLPWCRVNQTQELGQPRSRGAQPVVGMCRQNARVEAGKGLAWVLACSTSCCPGH